VIEEQLIALVSNVGFPIGITMWFMIRTEKVINRNTQAFDKIGEVVTKCQKK